MSKHLPILVQMAQVDIPTLESDVQNASNNPYLLKSICEKLIQIVGYLLHDRILDAHETARPVPAPPSTPRAPAVAPAPVLSAIPRLPVLPGTPQPSRAAAPLNLPGDLPIQPGVVNAFITEAGTTVVAPTGVRTVLPPGAPVPLEASAGLPPELPEAPEGVAQFVLPPGGGMTPEIAAAISGRSQEEPPQ
jgi:hypothetical protein